MTTCTAENSHQQQDRVLHFHLDADTHSTREEGMCLMELVAFLSGEEHSDNPKCASPVLSSYGRSINDSLGDERRQALLPMASALLNTRCAECEQKRALELVSLSLRESLGRWLERQGLRGAAQLLREAEPDLQSLLEAMAEVQDIVGDPEEVRTEHAETVGMGTQVCAYTVQHYYNFAAAECGDLEAAVDLIGNATDVPLFVRHLEQAIAVCPHGAARTGATYQCLLPPSTDNFQFELSDRGLLIRSVLDEDVEFQMLFGDQPPGQEHHAAQFLFEMWRSGFNGGREYQRRHPDPAEPADDQGDDLRPASESLGRRAVDLSKEVDAKLQGACPWCGAEIRVSVDVFYSRFVGGCPACGRGVAYRAPAGTFRTNVVDVAPGIWRIDRTHYCARCRYFVPDCSCQPRTVMPEGIPAHTPAPWEQSRIGP